MVAERLQLALADPRRQREQLLAQPQPLVEVVDVQQRGVAALERDQQRARVVEPVRHRQRLGAERQRALRAAGEVQAVGQPGAQLHGEQRGRRREARERLLEQRDPLAVDHARLGVAAGEAERGLGQRVAVARARGRARRRARTSRGRRDRRRAARSAPRASSVGDGSSPRAPVVLGRLLVGERGRGLLGGGERVADAPAGARLSEKW